MIVKSMSASCGTLPQSKTKILQSVAAKGTALYILN